MSVLVSNKNPLSFSRFLSSEDPSSLGTAVVLGIYEVSVTLPYC